MRGASDQGRADRDDEVICGGEVIYEMVPLGRLVRVAAMHAPTLVEVVVHGPASAGAAALRRLARARLARALERRAKRAT